MEILVTGIAGLFFCTAFQKTLDEKIPSLGAALKLWMGKKFPGHLKSDDDLELVARLIASTRAGISLDQSLESLLRSDTFGAPVKQRIALVLSGNPRPDFLSTLLAGALQAGFPLLSTLLLFQRILQSEKRVRLRAISLTSQSRAQGEVLAWLPWLLLAALALLDWEWLSAAAKNPFSWCLWALASLLIGAGRLWIKSLLEKAFAPRQKEEKIQEELLPPFLLQLIAALALGNDAETAWEKCQQKFPEHALYFQGTSPSLNGLKQIVLTAAKLGSPLKEELTNFLADAQLQTESRREERVQRLPVVMMAPLFSCFFPAALLVLLAVLYPLLREAI
jgi:hypothetical protein